MPWHSISPEGDKSVSFNESPMLDNTTYIETTMGNDIVGVNATGTRDHFWNVSSDLDGHHRFIKTPAFTEIVDGGPATPANPLVGNGIDLVTYSKLVTGFDVQPFSRNVKGVMQLLGIRAMALFISNASVIYQHNVANGAGVVKTGTGRYTITFTNSLPTDNYLVLGGAVANDAVADKLLNFNVMPGTLATTKTTTTLKLEFRDSTDTRRDPLQAWFICFGG